MALAQFVATWSRDPSTKVGAVVVGAGDRRKIAFGYNGLPPGVEDTEERLNDRETRLALTVHAEANAIYNATFDLTGATIYCVRMPCCECARGIVSKRIARVVYLVHPEYEGRWAQQVQFAKQIFEEMGVELCPIYG